MSGSKPRHPALRVWAAIRSTVLTAAAAVGAICALAFGASLVFGLKPLAVISGSMEPGIPVGSLVISQPVPAAEVEPGDIVTVERPRQLGLVTHRVVSNEALDGDIRELVLRGDANTADDPEPYHARTVGRYVVDIPYAGTFSMFIRTPSGLMAAAAVGLALIAVFLLDPARLQGAGPRRAGEPGADPAAEPVADPAPGRARG